MPMPRFLSLAYSLYFRDPQTTQRRKRTYSTQAHMAPCLRRRGNGKRVRFPERIATLRTRGMRRYPHKTSKLQRE
ncbi:hypothetical protein ALC57_04694 [Trachymyrmex cornetzi]|uniref:Uncharacterized protein n=1 Tax=Trachymyrmex cornetzi TaxID=471704 RepID=A0A195ECS2_9HYME|nr:hypothetical protein ALC57_04694 [Trachymyrmex cornetzi]